MHSANRAKMRLRAALEAAASKESIRNSRDQQKEAGRVKNIAFGTSTMSQRSKSLDRRLLKSSNKVMETSVNSTKDGPDSDSGLSGLELDSSGEAGPKKMDNNSTVDSGRRSQSLELLSDDLRSVSLSSAPSTPSPRPPSAVSCRGRSASGSGQKRPAFRGHVHFLSSSVDRSAQNDSPGGIVRNMVSSAQPDRPGQLRKSTSIPVHLTVSSTMQQALPASLRPTPTGALPNGHEDTCPSIRQKRWASSSSISSMPKRGTPTAETVSSLQRRRTRPTDFSGSLPRSASARAGFYSGASGAPSVPRSRSNVSMNEPHQRPPSSASSCSVSSRKSKPKTMNASMQIWQIQKELKRGEMVQGVLQLGPPRSTFGSRIREREEETCICAPVVIGRTNGHMEWRSM